MSLPLIYQAFLLQSLNRAASAVPIAAQRASTNATIPLNASPSEFVGFVDDPNGRGTVSLLINCLLTLVLCVWSALHLNVPHLANKAIDTCFCNLRWIIAGIFAPELVIFTAWRQWASAKILGDLVHSIYEVGNERVQVIQDGLHERTRPSILYRRKYKWTRAHDFFACTGGFAFEVESSIDHKIATNTTDYLPSSCPTRLSLTARGVALLAQCGLLPDIPEEVIVDKSKANDLAKAMVIIQASWMLLQTIGRLVARLPVTLLEVNTVAHVGCVFLMYILWWDKPLLPNEPIILEGDWVKPLCAYMYMSSEISGIQEIEHRKSQTWVKTIFAYLNWFERIPELENICLSTLQSNIDNENEIADGERADGHGAVLEIAHKSCLSELNALRLEKAANTAFFERRPRIDQIEASNPTSSPIVQRRWDLAHEAIRLYPTIQEKHVLYTHYRTEQNAPPQMYECRHFNPAPFVVRNVQNWPSDDLLRNVSGLMVGMVLWMLNFLYGAIHASAWNNHFPTVAEMWLWRVSATYIGFCGGLWIILNYAALMYPPLNEFWERWMDGISSWFYLAVLGSAVFICGFSFCFARGFILIEAFISIRNLSPAAYDTPDWTQIFPHF